MKRHTTRELSGTVLDERTVFTLHELCRVCGVHAELDIEMAEEGVLDPRGAAPAQWRFTGSAVTRAQKALKLSRDLRVTGQEPPWRSICSRRSSSYAWSVGGRDYAP